MKLSHDIPLTPIDEAIEILRTSVPRITGSELVILADACGRVLTEKLVASANVPSHANRALAG